MSPYEFEPVFVDLAEESPDSVRRLMAERRTDAYVELDARGAPRLLILNRTEDVPDADTLRHRLQAQKITASQWKQIVHLLICFPLWEDAVVWVTLNFEFGIFCEWWDELKGATFVYRVFTFAEMLGEVRYSARLRGLVLQELLRLAHNARSSAA